MRRATPAVVIAVVLGAGVLRWVARRSRRGSVESTLAHGRSLEWNLAGNSAGRPISVYLSPSYATMQTQRYAVLYPLRGFTEDDNQEFDQLRKGLFDREGLDSLFAQCGFGALVMFCYSYPDYSNEVPSPAGFYATREPVAPTELRPRRLAFPESSADVVRRIHTLERLPGPR